MARASSISARQRDLLRAVAAGRVAYRDPWPGLTARTGKPGVARWHVDGVEAYGGQHATLDSLVARGLVGEVTEGTAAVCTAAGLALLAADGPGQVDP